MRHQIALPSVRPGLQLSTGGGLIPVSVKETLVLGEPWPCHPAAETALQPRIWCSESSVPQASSQAECFFTDTGMSLIGHPPSPRRIGKPQGFDPGRLFFQRGELPPEKGRSHAMQNLPTRDSCLLGFLLQGTHFFSVHFVSAQVTSFFGAGGLKLS